MRILLIGGTGFLGTWLTREFGREHEVLVVDPKPFSAEQIDWLQEERAYWEYRRHHAGLIHECDVIVPLVGLLGSVASTEDPLGSLLMSGSFNLRLLIALASSGSRPLILFPSSDLAIKPRCMYSIHKRLVEDHLKLFQRVHGVPYVIFRMATGYGPWQRRDSVINFYVRRALCGESLPVYGHGDCKRAFIYASDAADAFRFALEMGLGGSTLNLVGHNHTLTRVAETVAELVGGQVVHTEWPELAKLVDVGSLPVYSRGLKKVGWSPRVSLREGIFRTRDWVVKHGS